VSRSDRHNLVTLTSNISLSAFRCESLRDLLTQIHSQETLGQLDGVELGSQGLEYFLPLHVGRQTPARSAANTVFAVQLNVQRVESVTARGKSDTDTVVEATAFGIVGSGFIL
jgi:hypothetical protein